MQNLKMLIEALKAKDYGKVALYASRILNQWAEDLFQGDGVIPKLTVDSHSDNLSEDQVIARLEGFCQAKDTDALPWATIILMVIAVLKGLFGK